MRTQASQQHKQQGRIPGIAIAMVVLCAAVMATVVGWVPSSIGSANDNSPPAKLSAVVPVQVGGAKEATADPGDGSRDRPTRPTCAERGVGCGVGNNVAGGTPASDQSEERVDVATFLAWHVQAHTLIQDAYQTRLSSLSQTEARADRPRGR